MTRILYWLLALVPLTAVLWAAIFPGALFSSSPTIQMMKGSLVFAPLSVLCLLGGWHSVRLGRTEVRGVVLMRESQPRAFAFTVGLYFVIGAIFTLLLVIGWIRALA